MKLPTYDVTLWYSENFNILNQIRSYSNLDPYETTQIGKISDLHWGFECPTKAIEFAENLFEVAAQKDILKLIVSSPYDTEFSRIVYKDSTKN